MTFINKNNCIYKVVLTIRRTEDTVGLFFFCVTVGVLFHRNSELKKKNFKTLTTKNKRQVWQPRI